MNENTETSELQRRLSDSHESSDMLRKRIKDLEKDKDESARMLGMATDLNLKLQSKADMWRDEFQRIKAVCWGKSIEFMEIHGICDRAMSDIQSSISLIDQREKAADEIARLRDYIDHAQRTLNAALNTPDPL